MPRSHVFTEWLASDEFAKQAAGHYPLDRPPRQHPPTPRTRYVVDPADTRQTIKGLGVEIMADSIGSGNVGLPDEPIAVPHDLLDSERDRLCTDMLTGFRYLRIAAGLYWRGLTADERQFVGRWPSQLAELRDMIVASGIEGVSLEYWSPAPFWKGSHRLAGNGDPTNRLKCFTPAFDDDPDYRGDVERFLADLAGAYITDLQTLRDAGIPVSIWNMQAEPFTDSTFPACPYTEEQYAQAFRAVAPAIRTHDPNITIIADTGAGWDFRFVRSVLDDPASSHMVDALAIHLIGHDSNSIRPSPEPSGKPRFGNEFEYLWGPSTAARCVNTVQTIMNWFQLGEAPTWFWLHALKPLGYGEASGYSLGYWRPRLVEYQFDDPPTSLPLDRWARDPNDPRLLQPGEWCWNKYNWHAVASFLKHLPWDSQVVAVEEVNGFDGDLRIFAFRAPDGRLTVVLSNRSFVPHTFDVELRIRGAEFRGVRYTPESAGPGFLGVDLGTQRGSSLSIPVPDMAWEFWTQA